MSEKGIEILADMYRALRQKQFSIHTHFGITLVVGSFYTPEEKKAVLRWITKVVQESANEQEAMDRLLSKEDQELLAKQVVRNKTEGYAPPKGFWINRLKIGPMESKANI